MTIVRIYFSFSFFVCVLVMQAQDSVQVKPKKFDRLQFNVQGALIANNSFSNCGYSYGWENYSKNSSTSVCFGDYWAIEFIVGRDKALK